MKGQSAQNIVNAAVTIQGSAKDPLVSAQIGGMSVTLGKTTVIGNGGISLREKELYLSEINLGAPALVMAGIEGFFALDTFSGSVRGNLESRLGNAEFNGPLSLRYNAPGGRQSWKQGWTLEMESSGLSSPLFAVPQPFSFALEKREKAWNITTGKGRLSIEGSLGEKGELSLDVGGSTPLRFRARGIVNKEKLDVNMDGIYLDASRISSLLASSPVSLYSALCTGNLHLGGTPAQPVFGGGITARNVEVNSPGFVTEHLTGEEIQLQAEGNRFSTGTIYLTTAGKNKRLLMAEMEIILKPVTFIIRW
jgi:hypothetical protein